MTYSRVWHDLFKCVARLIHMCDMTHLYVWHDSFICVTWLVHMCDMTRSYVWHGCLDEGGTDMCSTHMFFHSYVLSLICSFTDMSWQQAHSCPFISVSFRAFINVSCRIRVREMMVRWRRLRCVPRREMTQVSAKTPPPVCVCAHTRHDTPVDTQHAPLLRCPWLSRHLSLPAYTQTHTHKRTHTCAQTCVYTCTYKI